MGGHCTEVGGQTEKEDFSALTTGINGGKCRRLKMSGANWVCRYFRRQIPRTCTAGDVFVTLLQKVPV